jgi:hypothetical protein
MKRQRLHHILTMVLVLPMFSIAAWVAINEPELLNPWNKEILSEFWVYVLPTFLGSLGILTNSVLGFLGARDTCA